MSRSFGLVVPVILRNSEETESSTRVLKKRMRQVKNPFGLEITRPATASVTSQWISDVLDFCQFGFLNIALFCFLALTLLSKFLSNMLLPIITTEIIIFTQLINVVLFKVKYLDI